MAIRPNDAVNDGNEATMEGLPVASTIPVRTIQRFPVHPSLLDECAVAIEEVMLA